MEEKIFLGEIVKWKKRSENCDVCGIFGCKDKPEVHCPRCGNWYCKEHSFIHFHVDI